MKHKTLLAIILTATALQVPAATYTSIPNGRTWQDTKGSHINAHGGCIVWDNGYYYWFGESRLGMDSNGVGVYRSTDLYNWENLGLALQLQGEITNTLQDIAQGRLVERPKVVYNESTNKYVMWGHWEDGNDYTKARAVVAIADNIEGPYTFLRTYRPNSQMSRDQTVFVDEGVAFQIRASEDNATLHCTRLSDDYTKPTDNWVRIFAGKQFEAPAIMRIGDTYFGVFSECTGWDPNSAHVGMTKKLLSDSWTDLGNPCVDSGASTTYTSQSTYILKLEGYENAYMFMADRWNKSDVQTSTYVWLPIHIRTGYPILRWYDNWKTDIFQDMQRYKRAAEITDGCTYSLLSRLSDYLVAADGTTGLNVQSDDAKALQIVFEATDTESEYLLRDAATNLYLEGSGSSIRLADKSGSTAQTWIFTRQGDSFYTIKNKKLGTMMTISNGSTDSGTSVVLEQGSGVAKSKFGVYFDSKTYDYPCNDIFTQTPQQTDIVNNDNNEGGIDLPSLAAPTQLTVVATGNHTFALRMPSEMCDSEVMLSVFNAAGALVSQTIIAPDSVSGEAEFALPAATPAGLYIIRAADSHSQATTKIILK
jgi:hypothetical protein